MASSDGTERLRDPVDAAGADVVIVAADGTWSAWPFPSTGSLTLGRGPEADVRINDRAVSRVHLQLEALPARGYRLTDLGSANGTLLGADVMHSCTVEVHPGQPIVLGRTLVVVRGPACRGRAESWGPFATAPRAAMADLDILIAKVAPTLINVLLLGETGVGKDVAAERIHRASTRATGQLVKVNCAGLKADMLESELFGHEKGAFTGAVKAKRGLLESAAGGTFFLDEIGEMPLDVQAKLLLAIEQRKMRRLGGTEVLPIDARFLFATHRDLEAEAMQGRFRLDFFHRINGMPLRIPPLRERRNEIPALIETFAQELAGKHGWNRPSAFDPQVVDHLVLQAWSGNIRELRTVVERLVVLAGSEPVTLSVLAQAQRQGLVAPAPLPDSPAVDERTQIISALAQCGGNQSRAARILGIARNTLIARIKQYELGRPRGTRP